VQVRERGRSGSDRMEEAGLHPLRSRRSREGYAKGKDAQNLLLGVISIQFLICEEFGLPHEKQ